MVAADTEVADSLVDSHRTAEGDTVAEEVDRKAYLADQQNAQTVV